jgi:hypothetical protein
MTLNGWNTSVSSVPPHPAMIPLTYFCLGIYNMNNMNNLNNMNNMNIMNSMNSKNNMNNMKT